MRIAVIADIHGNSFALEAVLGDIARQSVDEIVVAGDLVNLFPNPRKTWEILKESGSWLLQGNHEYYLYTVEKPEAPPLWRTERFQPVQWTAQQFSTAEKAEMEALPWQYTQPGLLIVHASERSLFDNFVAATTDAELQTYYPNTGASLIVRGHNHHWLERNWDSRTVLMVNACGLPFGSGTVAPYAILTRDPKGWIHEKRAVRYDHAAAVQAMDEEYIHNVGALGLIFRRELQTAREQIMPLFQRYGEALQTEQISLRAAVERYLAEG
jgi:predicted phosphodiesterase